MIEKKNAKDYLEESAIQLLSKKAVDKVSVSDICKNCNVSTRTYYNYFKDKYDIINRCYFSRFEKYIAQRANELTFEELMLYLAEEVCKNPQFFRNVFGYTGQNNIRTGASDSLCELLLYAIKVQSHKEPSEEEKTSMRFFTDGILAYVDKQLSKANIPSAIESATCCLNAIPDNLKKYISH